MTSALEAFGLPKPVGVMGRSSSITNAFINGILPTRLPSEDDVAEALTVLGLSAQDLRCAYCGDRSTEWDHLRPLIVGKEPTGYISEIQNLVPSCGKCNQSKGNSEWRPWMRGTARLCPRTRCIEDLEERVTRLERFERWRNPTKLNVPEIVGSALWEAYRANWKQLLAAMRTSHELGAALRITLLGAIKHDSVTPAPNARPVARRADGRFKTRLQQAMRKPEATGDLFRSVSTE